MIKPMIVRFPGENDKTIREAKLFIESKPWVNFAFLYQPERIDFLKLALNALSIWPVDKLMITVTVNEIDDKNALLELKEQLIDVNQNVVLKPINITGKDPRILQWEHKKDMAEFLQSEYTHFIYSDADLVINYHVMDYWLKTKEMFDKYQTGFIPGTFRYEYYQGIDFTIDTTYRTDLSTLRIVSINEQLFFSPQEPFQGISIMDREMVSEHLNSPYANLDSVGVQGFGYGETAISGYIFHNPPLDFIHRILIPIDDYRKCWVLHLPNNYAANPYKEHGKIHAHTMFRTIKNQTR